ncbi:MAG: hypothetical protein ABW215_14000 [Kibdelosporangium sp.]
MKSLSSKRIEDAASLHYTPLPTLRPPVVHPRKTGRAPGDRPLNKLPGRPAGQISALHDGNGSHRPEWQILTLLPDSGNKGGRQSEIDPLGHNTKPLKHMTDGMPTRTAGSRISHTDVLAEHVRVDHAEPGFDRRRPANGRFPIAFPIWLEF